MIPMFSILQRYTEILRDTSSSGSGGSSSSSSSSDSSNEIKNYSNIYDAIDAEGVGATVKVNGKTMAAVSADGYQGSGNYESGSSGQQEMDYLAASGAATANYGGGSTTASNTATMTGSDDEDETPTSDELANAIAAIGGTDKRSDTSAVDYTTTASGNNFAQAAIADTDDVVGNTKWRMMDFPSGYQGEGIRVSFDETVDITSDDDKQISGGTSSSGFGTTPVGDLSQGNNATTATTNTNAANVDAIAAFQAEQATSGNSLAAANYGDKKGIADAVMQIGTTSNYFYNSQGYVQNPATGSILVVGENGQLTWQASNTNTSMAEASNASNAATDALLGTGTATNTDAENVEAIDLVVADNNNTNTNTETITNETAITDVDGNGVDDTLVYDNAYANLTDVQKSLVDQGLLEWRNDLGGFYAKSAETFADTILDVDGNGVDDTLVRENAYANLTEQEKLLVNNGTLVWDGSNFVAATTTNTGDETTTTTTTTTNTGDETTNTGDETTNTGDETTNTGDETTTIVTTTNDDDETASTGFTFDGDTLLLDGQPFTGEYQGVTYENGIAVVAFSREFDGVTYTNEAEYNQAIADAVAEGRYEYDENGNLVKVEDGEIVYDVGSTITIDGVDYTIDENGQITINSVDPVTGETVTTVYNVAADGTLTEVASEENLDIATGLTDQQKIDMLQAVFGPNFDATPYLNLNKEQLDGLIAALLVELGNLESDTTTDTTTDTTDSGISDTGLVGDLQQQIDDLKATIASLQGEDGEVNDMSYEDLLAKIQEMFSSYNQDGYDPAAYLNAFGFAMVPNADGTLISTGSDTGLYYRKAVKDRDTGEIRYINVPINAAGVAGGSGSAFRDERRTGFGSAISV